MTDSVRQPTKHSEPLLRPKRHSAVCLGCSLVCDDLEVIATGVDASICALAEKWFASSNSELPTCLVEGQPATIEEGTERAAELLSSAQAPLVYGLTQTTTPAGRAAVAIAESLGAVLDLDLPPATRAATLAKSRVGLVSATLGEIRNRCDYVLTICHDVSASHPRFFERFAAPPIAGEGNDRNGPVRKTVKPLSERTMHPDQIAGALTAIRLLLQERDFDRESVERLTGAAITHWKQIAAELKAAKYGAIVFDSLPESTANYELLFQLIRELNNHTRFVGCGLTQPANARGAMEVLTWSTGFPFAVNFAGPSPNFDPDRNSGSAILADKHSDVVLDIGGDVIRQLGTDTGMPPVIAIDHQETATTKAAVVTFYVAPPGHSDCEETAYRLDGVPLPVHLPPTSKTCASIKDVSDFDVLELMSQQLRYVGNSGEWAKKAT